MNQQTILNTVAALRDAVQWLQYDQPVPGCTIETLTDALLQAEHAMARECAPTIMRAAMEIARDAYNGHLPDPETVALLMKHRHETI